MAATVTLREKNGAGETPTDKTSGTVRFKQADDATVDANNPMVKPGTTQRSYEKWLRLYMGVTGPTGSITNVQFYTSGSPSSGITEYIRTADITAFVTPAIPANNSAGTDATTYVTGSRKNMGAGPYTSTSADFGNYAVLWIEISSSVAAPLNPSATVTVYMAYDET